MGNVLTGGCLCGDIRYRIAAAPVDALYCHCRMCRRAHGAPVVAWLAVPRAGFAVTAGSPSSYRSSAAASRQFCGLRRAANRCQYRQARRSRGGRAQPAHLDRKPDRLVRDRRRLAALPDKPAAHARFLASPTRPHAGAPDAPMP
jgi:Glutathione-dependent formaldehyde-activating enzyme